MGEGSLTGRGQKRVGNRRIVSKSLLNKESRLDQKKHTGGGSRGVEIKEEKHRRNAGVGGLETKGEREP